MTLANWRAVFGPPGITEEQAEEIRDVYAEILETEEWADAVSRNQWTSVWMEGEEFREFLAEEEARVAALYEELGL